MSLAVSAFITAMAPGTQTSFGASGGTPPYAFSVVPGGAGGTIDPSTGVYSAPASMNTDPTMTSDVIEVTDAAAATALSSPILVATPIFLLLEILWQELGLDPSRVFLYNQKIEQPTDESMFIVVSVLTEKIFANTAKTQADGTSLQSINCAPMLSINIKSRSTEALLRKEEVLMALASQYAQQQQELNSFLIGKLPMGSQFVNLSEIDGDAIPYRFNISINMQYFIKKSVAAPYFDTFQTPQVVTQQ